MLGTTATVGALYELMGWLVVLYLLVHNIISLSAKTVANVCCHLRVKAAFVCGVIFFRTVSPFISSRPNPTITFQSSLDMK